MRVAIVIPNYNSGPLVIRAVEAMLSQITHHDVSVKIAVVDDGSLDDSASKIDQRFGSRIQLIRLGRNQGRSTARNAGVSATESDVIIFVDSDCIPLGDQFISSHLATFAGGADISFGNITTPGTGFWDRLQRNSARWRLKALQAGELWTFTTQNVAISRQLFETVGGFDPVFDRHGFEDRDLFIKGAKSGARVEFTEQAKVLHADRISLASVSRKMGDAGLHVAWEFDDLHPDEYSRMHFSRLDCRRRPWLRTVDRLAWPLARWVSAQPGDWLESRWLPFAFRALGARTVYGLSFMHGTAVRRPSDHG